MVTPRKETHLPGEIGVWVFIAIDMLVFGMFFNIYMYYRSLNLEQFSLSQSSLNSVIGMANTLLLLTSSWVAVMGLKAVRRGNSEEARAFILATLVLGLCFCVLKVFEYERKFYEGFGLTSNEFFTFYFMLTGIHLLHVIIGLICLTYLWVRLKGKTISADDVEAVESATVYWHMVDLLWIVIFPLLYLLR